MSREYSFDLYTASVKSLFTIVRRDEETIRFTNADYPITIGSETWEVAAGLTLYDVSDHRDGSASTTQLQVSCDEDGPITPRDVAEKMYEGAIVSWDLCDGKNPIAKDFHFYGRVGDTSRPMRGQVVFQLQSHLGFPRSNLGSTYTVMCRWPFGGTMCGMPVMRPNIERSTTYAVGDFGRHASGSPADYGNRYFEVTAITTGVTAGSAPSFDYTIAATTVDGGVTWTARNSWERYCVIGEVPNAHNMKLSFSPDVRAINNWYNPGKIMFTSGRNKNRIFRVGGWRASDLQLTTYAPSGMLTEVGDTALIWPDCDKTISMCVSKYNNARRFGGFPFYQGANAATQIF